MRERVKMAIPNENMLVLIWRQAFEITHAQARLPITYDVQYDEGRDTRPDPFGDPRNNPNQFMSTYEEVSHLGRGVRKSRGVGPPGSAFGRRSKARTHAFVSPC